VFDHGGTRLSHGPEEGKLLTVEPTDFCDKDASGRLVFKSSGELLVIISSIKAGAKNDVVGMGRGDSLIASDFNVAIVSSRYSFFWNRGAALRPCFSIWLPSLCECFIQLYGVNAFLAGHLLRSSCHSPDSLIFLCKSPMRTIFFWQLICATFNHTGDPLRCNTNWASKLFVLPRWDWPRIDHWPTNTTAAIGPFHGYQTTDAQLAPSAGISGSCLYQLKGAWQR